VLGSQPQLKMSENGLVGTL